MTRGIFAACHVRPTRPLTQAELDDLYAAAYGDEPFVRIVTDATGDQARPRQQRGPGLVRRRRADGRVLAIGVLDNLVKGAAGQAIQAFNVVHGLPETAGLDQLPLAP